MGDLCKKDVFQVVNGDPNFETEYNIPLNAILILKNEPENNDLILYSGDFIQQLKLGFYKDQKVTDYATGKPETSSNIEILGCVIAKLEVY